MQSRARDIVNLIRGAGLEVLRHYGKSGRQYADAVAPNGVEHTFSISAGAKEDRSGDFIVQGKMRRFARNNPASPASSLAELVQQIEEEYTTEANMTKAVKTEKPVSAAAQDLTPVEFYRLCEWTKLQPLDQHPGAEAMAVAATIYIGHPVSEGTLREAMTATTIEEPEHWNPPGDPQLVVAWELGLLMKQLGVEPSKAFARLLASIG